MKEIYCACGARVSIEDDYPHRSVICPNCGASIDMEGSSSPAGPQQGQPNQPPPPPPNWGAPPPPPGSVPPFTPQGPPPPPSWGGLSQGPPPPGGMGAPGPQMRYPADLTISVGNCIGDAWQTVKSDIGQFILATFIYFAIIGGVSLFSCFGEVARWFIEPPLLVGYAYFCLVKIRGQYADMNVLFSGFKRYWSSLGVYWLSVLLTSIAMIPAGLVMIPVMLTLPSSGAIAPLSIGLLITTGIIGLVISIYITIGLLLAQFFMMDRGYTAWDSIKSSWEITKGERWSILAVVIVSGLINLLGILMCFVGLLITIPIGMSAIASVYHRLSLQQAMANPAPPQSNFGPPPFGGQPPSPPSNWDALSASAAD